MSGMNEDDDGEKSIARLKKTESRESVAQKNMLAEFVIRYFLCKFIYSTMPEKRELIDRATNFFFVFYHVISYEIVPEKKYRRKQRKRSKLNSMCRKFSTFGKEKISFVE